MSTKVRLVQALIFPVVIQPWDFFGRNDAKAETPVLLPGKSHGQKSLVGYSPRGRKESDTTELLHFTSVLGDGDGQGSLKRQSRR